MALLTGKKILPNGGRTSLANTARIVNIQILLDSDHIALDHGPNGANKGPTTAPKRPPKAPHPPVPKAAKTPAKKAPNQYQQWSQVTAVCPPNENVSGRFPQGRDSRTLSFYGQSQSVNRAARSLPSTNTPLEVQTGEEGGTLCQLHPGLTHRMFRYKGLRSAPLRWWRGCSGAFPALGRSSATKFP